MSLKSPQNLDEGEGEVVRDEAVVAREANEAGVMKRDHLRLSDNSPLAHISRISISLTRITNICLQLKRPSYGISTSKDQGMTT